MQTLKADGQMPEQDAFDGAMPPLSERPKKGRHRRHANPFSIRHEVAPFKPHQHFARAAPMALDIGCGPGAFVAALAKARPATNVLGLEIRPHLVEVGRALLAQMQISNADVIYANANLHVDALVPDGTLSMVTVNFADPWFKKKHHKRRVVTPQLAATLLRKLQPQGEVHVMTDVEALAVYTRQVLKEAGFVDAYPPGVWPSHSTTGVQSEREQWHLSRGDAVWRMRLSKVTQVVGNDAPSGSRPAAKTDTSGPQTAQSPGTGLRTPTSHGTFFT